ncbi:MAG: glutaredoxin domain-containing protein [Patescibacteria group bacterium]
MKKVSIYTTPTCTYCKLAKQFFHEHNVEYEEFDVASNLEKRQEMIEKTQQMGVPVIDAGGQIVIGFDEDALKTALGI